MKQYVLSPRQLSALENVLASERGKAAGFVRDSLAYIRFEAATLYYLPRSEPERREFVRLAKKAGFDPVESGFANPLTTSKRRGKVYTPNQNGRA